MAINSLIFFRTLRLRTESVIVTGCTPFRYHIFIFAIFSSFVILYDVDVDVYCTAHIFFCLIFFRFFLQIKFLLLLYCECWTREWRSSSCFSRPNKKKATTFRELNSMRWYLLHLLHAIFILAFFFCFSFQFHENKMIYFAILFFHHFEWEHFILDLKLINQITKENLKK